MWHNIAIVLFRICISWSFTFVNYLEDWLTPTKSVLNIGRLHTRRTTSSLSIDVHYIGFLQTSLHQSSSTCQNSIGAIGLGHTPVYGLNHTNTPKTFMYSNQSIHHEWLFTGSVNIWLNRSIQASSGVVLSSFKCDSFINSNVSTGIVSR